MPQPRLEVLYNFSEVEVKESTEPYPFPVAQINIMHSTRDKSGMGVLGRSIDRIINAGVDGNAPQDKVRNQDFLIGKVQEWKVTPGHMMWNAQAAKETERECWEVVAVEGVGSAPDAGAPATGTPTTATPSVGATTSPSEQAMNLLGGKTQQEWNNIVFQDPLVKTDIQLTQSIISGQFVGGLEASGLITKDDNGIYHLVKSA